MNKNAWQPEEKTKNERKKKARTNILKGQGCWKNKVLCYFQQAGTPSIAAKSSIIINKKEISATNTNQPQRKNINDK